MMPYAVDISARRRGLQSLAEMSAGSDHGHPLRRDDDRSIAKTSRVEANQAAFRPPESDPLPAVLRPTPNLVTTPDEGRPRSGRASRAVTEIMKVRSSGGGAPLVMLHPDRDDLFFMEGVWYDSRGVEWDPTNKPFVNLGAQDKPPIAAAEELTEHCETPCESRQPLAKPHDTAPSRADGAPPEWVMGLLDGNVLSQRRASEDPSRASRSAVASANQNMGYAEGTRAVHHDTAGVSPVQHRGIVTGQGNDAPEDDSDDHDDFNDMLERDLSRGSIKSAPKRAGSWKISSGRSATIDNDLDEDDGEYAEHLAIELQRGVAGALPAATARPAGQANKPRRPTSAERREQDAKWMACS